ncbi:MAG: hypothetical protein FJ191_06755 [Gammaproteobacteria bacterium]|nr:hypothetical protein [Gammaproteobacteria bacterium]
MRIRRAGPLLIALALSACGGQEAEPEEPPLAVEDTVFGDLVGTQDKVRDRTNAAMESHREAFEQQLEAGEGSAPAE